MISYNNKLRNSFLMERKYLYSNFVTLSNDHQKTIEGSWRFVRELPPKSVNDLYKPRIYVSRS